MRANIFKSNLRSKNVKPTKVLENWNIIPYVKKMFVLLEAIETNQEDSILECWKCAFWFLWTVSPKCWGIKNATK